MYDDLTEFTSPYVDNFMKLATAKPGMVLNCVPWSMASVKP